MSRTKLQNICDIFARQIIQEEKSLSTERVEALRLKSEIAKLTHQPTPNTALIAALKSQLETLESIIPIDQAQLEALKEDFNANCR
jgi:chromosome segregation ATPase